MCRDCWDDAGRPADITPDTARLVELIGRLYEIHPTGGPLHVELDDWNIDGARIRPDFSGWSAADLDALWYAGFPIAELDPNAPAVVEQLGVSTRMLCLRICRLLNGMTLVQRYAALAYSERFITLPAQQQIS